MSRASAALPGLAASLAAGMLLQGAFYGGQLAILCVVLGLTTILCIGSMHTPRAVWLAFGSLAAGLIASGFASGWPRASAKPVATLAVAVLAFIVAERAIEADGARAVADLCVAVGALVAVAGIAGVALHIDRLALHEHPWRLTSTLTYQNAAGALFAVALPVALVGARGRALARAAAVLIVTALAGTLSRGAFVAAIAGLLVLAGARALEPATVVRVAAGGAIATGALVAAMLDVPGSPVVVLAGLVTGLAVAAGERIAMRTLAAGLGVAVLAGVLAVSVTPLKGRVQPTTTDRARVWRQSLERVPDHLVFGTGPGTYDLVAPKDGRIVRTRFAHNEYIQALSETGIVGLTTVATALGMLAWGVWRARRRDGVWAAAAAGLSGFAIHSGLDLLWRIPALVAFMSVLLALATAEKTASASNEQGA